MTLTDDSTVALLRSVPLFAGLEEEELERVSRVAVTRSFPAGTRVFHERVGRFLRRTSLDEVPQLWNVLKGEMSVVGPRPLSERDDAKVEGWQRHRLDVVPGMTGYWQVLGRNNIPFQEMLEVDYCYVTSWTFWHDMKLLLKTVPVVLMRRGAN